MQANTHFKILSVRLPETELRRFKGIAAKRGVNLQTAVYQALQVWASPLKTARSRSLGSLKGSLKGFDFEGLMRRQREEELKKEERWS